MPIVSGCLPAKNWSFEFSCGFQDMVYWCSNEVHHGEEGVDVPVSTGSALAAIPEMKALDMSQTVTVRFSGPPPWLFR